MFELHCNELISGLAKRAESLAQKMLSQMSKKHQEENERSLHCIDTPLSAACFLSIAR